MSNTPAAPVAPPPRAARRFESFAELSNFIFQIADRLRGKYKPSEYAKVILPLTVIRRFDCVLRDHRDAAREVYAKHLRRHPPAEAERRTLDELELPFVNTSPHDLESIRGEAVRADLIDYLNGFSPAARDVLDHFRFHEQIDRLAKADLLYGVVAEFAAIDLHPDAVDNHAMGSAFEDLIRRFAEQSNETAGEHYTPREVIELMVDLVLHGDEERLARPGFAPSLYDPACGTGGMLSVAEERIRALNPAVDPQLYGQELNDESYAICKGDMMLRGHVADHVAHGNSFTQDGHEGATFDYMLSNPPFGVDWKNIEERLRRRHETEGDAGPFAAGLPRVSDGALLFLQLMASKMKDASRAGGGSRIAVVFNGSPLFTGDAGSGESEIRGWFLGRDRVEAIIALPDQLFFNTGISTYVWIVTNRKAPHRRGRVQLIDATDLSHKMRRALGEKRNELSPDDRAAILDAYRSFSDTGRSRVFLNEDFAFRRVVVERPLRLSYRPAPERLAAVPDAVARALAKPRKGTSPVDVAAVTAALLAALGTLDGARSVPRRDDVREAVSRALAKAKTEVPSVALDAAVDALGARDETAEPVRDAKGNLVPDPELRDYESVPVREEVAAFLAREVLPHAPDAWVDEAKTRVGWEIPFARHFYKYTPPRPLGLIEGEIRALEAEIQGLLGGVGA
ncbi:MAG: class I SAM-dependent DNA methyltransferase [Polyangiales bacterium]